MLVYCVTWALDYGVTQRQSRQSVHGPVSTYRSMIQVFSYCPFPALSSPDTPLGISHVVKTDWTNAKDLQFWSLFKRAECPPLSPRPVKLVVANEKFMFVSLTGNHAFMGYGVRREGWGRWGVSNQPAPSPRRHRCKSRKRQGRTGDTGNARSDQCFVVTMDTCCRPQL